MEVIFLLQKFHSEELYREKKVQNLQRNKRLRQTTVLFQFDAETNHLSWYTRKRISKAERKSIFFPRRKQNTEVERYSHHICKLESSFLTSTKTLQNNRIYIWIPAKSLNRHMSSTPRRVTYLLL